VSRCPPRLVACCGRPKGNRGSLSRLSTRSRKLARSCFSACVRGPPCSWSLPCLSHSPTNRHATCAHIRYVNTSGDLEVESRFYDLLSGYADHYLGPGARSLGFGGTPQKPSLGGGVLYWCGSLSRVLCERVLSPIIICDLSRLITDIQEGGDGCCGCGANQRSRAHLHIFTGTTRSLSCGIQTWSTRDWARTGRATIS
jgi:hypothetical protein